MTKIFREKKKTKKHGSLLNMQTFLSTFFSLAIQQNSCLHWVWLVLTLHVSQRRLKVYRCISYIWKDHAILNWALEQPPILWSTGIPRTTLHEHGGTTMYHFVSYISHLPVAANLFCPLYFCFWNTLIIFIASRLMFETPLSKLLFYKALFPSLCVFDIDISVN